MRPGCASRDRRAVIGIVHEVTMPIATLVLPKITGASGATLDPCVGLTSDPSGVAGQRHDPTGVRKGGQVVIAPNR